MSGNVRVKVGVGVEVEQVTLSEMRSPLRRFEIDSLWPAYQVCQSLLLAVAVFREYAERVEF